MTSSWAASYPSHPSLSKTGMRDDPSGANAAIAKRLIGAASGREKKIATRERLLSFYRAGSPF
ncbi:hypothetical protein [Nostoc sp. LPT]|uniref:hypothetical protein n=1 Tax=Nostoc sp. LPT TaxID=2815387 RepID=UPI001DF04324|nr:hypothetical protein [Nostoc sp. LPT]MBN4002169.1 hypothetical protein [Nostoc sp. LPT]